MKAPLSISSQKAIPSYERVQHFNEYWVFVNWIATPTPLRKPQTQEDLSKELSVNGVTLSRWKCMPEYRRDVNKLVAEKMGDYTADVSYALLNRIFKDGNAAEIRLFREWAQEWMPSINVNLKGEFGSDERSQNLIKQLANEFDQKLRNALSKKDAQGV